MSTDNPSFAPTRSPVKITNPPTRSPTKSPTPSFTPPPTQLPTSTPTLRPTTLPTQSPISSTNVNTDLAVTAGAVGGVFGSLVIIVLLALLVSRSFRNSCLSLKELFCCRKTKSVGALIAGDVEDKEKDDKGDDYYEDDSPEAIDQKSYTLFFSYAKKDAVAETSMLYDSALEYFPASEIFRDAENHFKLSQLIKHVRKSRNVIVLLSPNYARRPYTLIELHAAIQSGANICPVRIQRDGLKSFDFEALASDIKLGKIRHYLDSKGWEILNRYHITVAQVSADLQTVLNVRAYEYNSSSARAIRSAMTKEIFEKGLQPI